MTISHPALEPFAEERAEIDAREATLRASRRALLDPYKEQMAVWEVKRDEALALGAGPPPEPDAPDCSQLDREIRLLDNERERLDVREEKVLASIAPEIEAELVALSDALLVRIAPNVTALAEARDEYHDLLRVAVKVRGAVDRHNPNGRPAPGWGTKPRTRSTITIHDLIDAQMFGGDLLEIRPVQGSPSVAVQVDRVPAETRGSGFTPPHPFGDQPKRPKPKRRDEC